MENILDYAERVIAEVSSIIWPIFLPFMLIVGAYMAFKTLFVVQKRTTKKAKMKLKNVIGPASISLGAMIGTGAIIGVLGSLSNLVGQGQQHLEAMAIWALIGAIIMVPVSYAETLNAKIMKKTPNEYIAMLLSPKAAVVYVLAFCALYIFGFGGFQFSGIDAVLTIISGKYLHIDLSQVQRYLFIVLPIFLIVATIVLSKKHSLFMNAMTYMIGTAVVSYFIFFTIFVWKTADHLPSYFSNMIEGMLNPVNMLAGIPLGFVLGMQRVLQTAETGLGALAMAAQEADSKPREAAAISLLPTIVTIVVSIVVTSYIVSYGVEVGIVVYPADAITRLGGYFETAISVTGTFGLVVLSAFTVLSALTTLLGSYFFLTQLYHHSENKNIVIYLLIVITAGTLAVFGFNILFEVVDMLLFVVAGINVSALAVFVRKKWKDYQLMDERKGKIR